MVRMLVILNLKKEIIMSKLDSDRSVSISLEQIIASSTIILIAKRFAWPKWITVDIPRNGWRTICNETPRMASEVFEILGLDLSTLSQIFPANNERSESKTFLGRIEELESLPPINERKKKTTVPSYNELGACPVVDKFGWQALSILMKKELQVYYLDKGGSDHIPRIYEQGVYYPDGHFTLNEELKSILPTICTIEVSYGQPQSKTTV